MSKWNSIDFPADNRVGDYIAGTFEDNVFYPIWDTIFVALDSSLYVGVRHEIMEIFLP